MKNDEPVSTELMYVYKRAWGFSAKGLVQKVSSFKPSLIVYAKKKKGFIFSCKILVITA